jgi:hypothetical protein
VWRQVGDRIGGGLGIFFPVSDLDEVQRGAFVTRWDGTQLRWPATPG